MMDKHVHRGPLVLKTTGPDPHPRPIQGDAGTDEPAVRKVPEHLQPGARAIKELTLFKIL